MSWGSVTNRSVACWLKGLHTTHKRIDRRSAKRKALNRERTETTALFASSGQLAAVREVESAFLLALHHPAPPTALSTARHPPLFQPSDAESSQSTSRRYRPFFASSTLRGGREGQASWRRR